MDIQQGIFGQTPEGKEIKKFTLSNDHGMSVVILSYGAILAATKTPDRSGNVGDVALGLRTLEDYLSDTWFLGATIGRYANRIAKGRFNLDGRVYQLAQNSPPSHLHGGYKGFHKVVWQSETEKSRDSASVILSYLSPDGEEGYPGNLSVAVTYSLNERNELALHYQARTDKPTPVNFTNHTYWNLKGFSLGYVLDHVLTLNADHYLPTDEDRIPTGEISSVEGTPMDFREPTKIGLRIGRLQGGGYNHCYVLRKKNGLLSLAATVYEPWTGRVMEVSTTEPGMQLYSGHFLDGYRSVSGLCFEKYHGVCLEAQHFPNSVNQPHFPPTLLRPGKVYAQTTTYRFSVQ